MALNETPIAYLALVGPLAGVDSYVSLEVILPLKFASAVLAFVQSDFTVPDNWVNDGKLPLKMSEKFQWFEVTKYLILWAFE